MKYKLGKYVFTKDEEYRYEDIYTNGEYLEFEKKTLIDLGATPIDDKLECLCSCHKNGYNGTHDESRCLCHKPVREIEPIDLGDPIDPPFDIETIEVKLNQLITSHNQLQKAVNSLKGE